MAWSAAVFRGHSARTWFASLALLVLSISCGACDRGVSFESEATRVEAALTAPTAKVLERGRATKSALRIKQAWRLAAPGDWRAYAVAVEAALAPSYRCAHDTATLSCSRSMPGDLLQLRLNAEPKPDGLVIGAELQAGPD